MPTTILLMMVALSAAPSRYAALDDTEFVQAVAISRKDGVIAVAMNGVWPGSNPRILVFDPKDGRMKRDIRLVQSDPIVSLVFLNEETLVLARMSMPAVFDCKIESCDLQSGRFKPIKLNDPISFGANPALDVDSAGNLLIGTSTAEEIRVIDVTNKRDLLRVQRKALGGPLALNAKARKVAFAPWGFRKRFAEHRLEIGSFGSDTTVRVELSQQTIDVSFLQWIGETSTLVALDSNSDVWLWSKERGVRKVEMPPSQAIRVPTLGTSDGRFVGVFNRELDQSINTAWLVDVENGKVKGTFRDVLYGFPIDHKNGYAMALLKADPMQIVRLEIVALPPTPENDK